MAQWNENQFQSVGRKIIPVPPQDVLPRSGHLDTDHSRRDAFDPDCSNGSKRLRAMRLQTSIIISTAVALICSAMEVAETMSRSAMLAQRPTRIVGGKDAEKGLHPWQMSVHWGDRSKKIQPRHVCGGSLLTAGWVLTAGHCVTLAPSKGEYLILGGKYKLGVPEDTEQSRLVKNAYVHPLYDGTVAPYDIALMSLEQPFDLNPFVSTVALPYPDSIPSGDVMLSGWGSIGRTRRPKTPEKLQAAVLPIVDYALCKLTLDKSLKRKDKNPLHPTNICTGPLDGSLSACKGDSGGPLVRRNDFGEAEVVGIVSWGLFPCGGKNAPSVYTRVSAFVTWIIVIMLNYS
nr:trypsin-like [Megalopta genalis]